MQKKLQEINYSQTKQLKLRKPDPLTHLIIFQCLTEFDTCKKATLNPFPF